ncbi:streptomycin biosynthesis protein [Kutzneria sp. CA-103260]|uniref:streptomycin biosynthesis protein n=1 Tax=Kutzneria sp. CA-103260 TaxID=2802641 RepID=UPI001BEE8A7A|nr:streptomycin biosynthesis protein [Kutzneria sp. CA-103260]QUQ65286.1 streptomycin biosynthesis operon possible regulatory protein [Kutzneria sp. CA-103260]
MGEPCVFLPCDSVDAPSPWCEYQSGNHPTEMVPIIMLRPADSPRTAGENTEHVRALAELDVPLPPIFVHRPTMRVIDGMHRLHAAALRARHAIEVYFFDGDEDDAFVLAVEANTKNGLPLSLVDRKAAAARIIATHPHHSDRWIALVSGLTATTIGAIRKCSTVEDSQSNTRVGRDGRTRPLDSSNGRRLAAELMLADPRRSLRDVARVAGIAPSTAFDVRNRLNSGADPVPAKRVTVTTSDQSEGRSRSRRRGRATRPESGVDPVAILQTLRNDPSLRFNEAGRVLLRWLDAYTVGGHAAAPPIDNIPAHCICTITALARHNASFWAAFSERLDDLDEIPP